MKARSLRPARGSRSTASAMSRWRDQWTTWRDSHFTPRWQAMAPRERLGLLLALAALGLLLVWQIAFAPALATLRSAAPAQLALQAQLAQMQSQAAEAQRLRQQLPVPAAQAEAALRALTERLGPSARLNLQGDRATVNFTGIDGASLLAWLSEARSAARAKPVEAQLSRVGTGYSGSLTLLLTTGA